jgi:APA family basic amino acid/polyamine antiporter
VYGVLQSAGFLFFAFAGYARIATLGEEVKDPAITIPRAIPRALAAVLAVYFVVGVTALAVVPASALAAKAAPLHVVIEAGRLDSLAPVVDIGAGIAALGVLLNLIPGVSRTSFAMARERELPHLFAHVDTTRSLPLRAELTVAGVVIVLVVVLDLRSAIGISGVAVLTYYAITNASALTLRHEQRRWPALIAVVGLLGCVTLVAALPPTAILTGVITLAVGYSSGSRRDQLGDDPDHVPPSAVRHPLVADRTYEPARIVDSYRSSACCVVAP